MQRLPAKMRMRQHKQFLREALRRIARRQHGIGKEIVRRGKPRRGEVADARDLYGRGPICEDRKRPARRVSGKIDEDIDAVAIDRTRRFLSGKLREVSKNIHCIPHFFRKRVRAVHRVDKHLKTGGVKRRHQRMRKGEHDMLPHIGRKIPDAEPPLP